MKAVHVRALEILVVISLFAAAFGIFDLVIAQSPIESSLRTRIEAWFFDTTESPAGLVAAIAGWMTWNRLRILSAGRTAEANGFQVSHVTRAFLPLALCCGVMAWAVLNDAGDLLFVAGAILLGTYGVYCAGLRGLRLMAVPMLTLCFALPIPYPLHNEVVWTLQNWSAAGTAQALSIVGAEFERSGAHIAYGDFYFLVIEGCSGLRSILTLTLVAIVLRDLMRNKSLIGWIPVLAAPLLAMVLNILRIAAIVLSSSGNDSVVDSEHIGQGLAVLIVGTLLLFFASDRIAQTRRLPAPLVAGDLRTLPLRPLAIALLVLSLVRWVIVPWPPPVFEGQSSVTQKPGAASSSPIATPFLNPPTRIDFPDEREPWKREPASIDFPFIGNTPRGSIERKRYQRDPGADRPLDRVGGGSVELQIATSSSTRPRMNPFSSKLILPGRQWQIEETNIERHFVLGQEIAISRVSAPGGEEALVFSWARRDEGFWRETLRSALALERGPFARSKPRIYIHLATSLGEGEEDDRYSKRFLNRFVADFRDSFRAM